MSRKEQLDRLIAKHKELIASARQEELAELYGAWVGLIYGLWITGAITSDRHRELYQEIMKFREEERCRRMSKEPA